MKSANSISAQTVISKGWKSGQGVFPILGKMLAALFAFCFSVSAFAQNNDIAVDMAAKKLQSAGFEQRLGAQIPTELSFTDENGEPVKLEKYFNGQRPVVLTLNYLGCPMLCTMILNGVVDCAKALPFKLGRDYDIVTVSFDPRDTPKLAAKKKANYLSFLGQPGTENGWHFLTGKKEQIDALCKAVGFSYVFDEKSGEFGHASGIMVSTPTGKLSHYFYGIDFNAKDVKLGLIDASQGKIGSPVEKLLLWCMHYDPVSGKYTASIMRIIQIGCGAIVAVVATFLIVSLRREFRHPRKAVV